MGWEDGLYLLLGCKLSRSYLGTKGLLKEEVHYSTDHWEGQYGLTCNKSIVGILQADPLRIPPQVDN